MSSTPDMRVDEARDEVVVTLTPASTASARDAASVIWVHGLGADGHDFVPIIPELRLCKSRDKNPFFAAIT